jgi:hypothetical protein
MKMKWAHNSQQTSLRYIFKHYPKIKWASQVKYCVVERMKMKLDKFVHYFVLFLEHAMIHFHQ